MRNLTLRDPAFLGTSLQYAVSSPTANLQFAATRTLVDSVSGSNLLTVTRAAATGTFFDASGVLQTASADTARFDNNPLTLESLGLRVEEARTNFYRNNTMVGAATGIPGTAPTNWDIAIGGSGISREIVGIASESGVSYIDPRFFGTGSASATPQIRPETTTQIVAAAGQTWTASYYIRLVGGSLAGLPGSPFQHIWQERNASGASLTVGTVVVSNPTTTILPAQRSVTSRTLTEVGTARLTNRLQWTFTNGVAADITVRIGLPQIEIGDTVTSPILGSTAPVTRNADAITSTASALLTAGTLFIEFRSPAVGIRGIYTMNDGTSGNRIDIRTSGTTAQVLVVTGGITQTTLSVGTITANARARIAIRLASGGVAASINGGAVVSAAATRPTVTAVAIGQTQAGEFLNSTIAAITTWAVEFTDAMLVLQST